MSQFTSTEAGTRTQSRLEKYEQDIRKEYLLEIEQDEEGWIVAKCLELNVVTQGKTLEEIQRNAIEAIELALDSDNQFTLRIVEKTRV